MGDEQRFALGARGDPTAEPGLVRDEIGRVYVIAPDGTRTLLPDNGGSQPVRMESKAVAYNTANIKVSDGGVVFFTAEAGEFLTDAAAPIVLTTPFNGSSPTFVLFAQGDDPTNTGNYLSTLVLAGTTVTAVGTKASRLVGASNFQSTGLPCLFSVQTVVMIAFGDGSGGDDDSTAGAATVVLPVWTAA